MKKVLSFENRWFAVFAGIVIIVAIGLWSYSLRLNKVTDVEEHFQADHPGSSLPQKLASTVEFQKGIENRSVQSFKFINTNTPYPERDQVILAMSTDQMPVKSKDDDFNQMYYYWPSILVRHNKKWRQLELKEYQSYSWTLGVVDGQAGKIWGFLDWTVESPTEYSIVIFSDDWGVSWTALSRMPKPDYRSYLQSFHLDIHGNGYAVVTKDDADDETEERLAIRKTGATQYFRVHTKDEGRTWQLESKPFLIDSLVAGESEYCGQPSLERQWKKEDPCRISLFDPY